MDWEEANRQADEFLRDEHKELLEKNFDSLHSPETKELVDHDIVDSMKQRILALKIVHEDMTLALSSA